MWGIGGRCFRRYRQFRVSRRYRSVLACWARCILRMVLGSVRQLRWAGCCVMMLRLFGRVWGLRSETTVLYFPFVCADGGSWRGLFFFAGLHFAPVMLPNVEFAPISNYVVQVGLR